MKRFWQILHRLTGFQICNSFELDTFYFKSKVIV